MIKNRDSINEDIKRNDLPQGEKHSKKFTDFIGNIFFKLSKGENYSKKLNDVIFKIVVIIFFVSSLISAIAFLLRPPSPRSSDIYSMLGVDTPEYWQNISPSDEKIFDSDKPVPEQLSQILLSDSVKVYENDSTLFVMAENRVNEKDLPALSEKIKNAVEVEAETEEGETIMYYLALFDDRRKVIFSLSETTLEIYGKKYRL